MFDYSINPIQLQYKKWLSNHLLTGGERSSHLVQLVTRNCKCRKFAGLFLIFLVVISWVMK